MFATSYNILNNGYKFTIPRLFTFILRPDDYSFHILIFMFWLIALTVALRYLYRVVLINNRYLSAATCSGERERKNLYHKIYETNAIFITSDLGIEHLNKPF